MGNRQELGIHLPVINPPNNPYLHIVSFDGARTYGYVPSLSGIRISSGRITNSTTPIEYSLQKRLEIPLLPANRIDKLPSPIDTATHVDVMIQEHEETLLEIEKGLQFFAVEDEV